MTINLPTLNATLFPYTTLFRSNEDTAHTFTALEFGFTDPNDSPANALLAVEITTLPGALTGTDRKSTRLNSSHRSISYAVISFGIMVFTPAANANGSPESSFTF